MSMCDKIKAAAMMAGVDRQELAAAMGITPQALSNKYQRDSFNGGDLIRAAAALGYTLTLQDKNNNSVIAFAPEDAAPPRRSQALSAKKLAAGSR